VQLPARLTVQAAPPPRLVASMTRHSGQSKHRRRHFSAAPRFLLLAVLAASAASAAGQDQGGTMPTTDQGGVIPTTGTGLAPAPAPLPPPVFVPPSGPSTFGLAPGIGTPAGEPRLRYYGIATGTVLAVSAKQEGVASGSDDPAGSLGPSTRPMGPRGLHLPTARGLCP